MSTTFDHADTATLALARGVMKQYHPELADVELTFNVLLATPGKNENGEPIGPALKHHGWPALAIVKLNSYQDRVEGKPDITIKIDADWWKEHSEPEQRALLDHELMHVKVRIDDDGNALADDCGRPKLTMRPHDWEFSGFRIVAERHRDHSQELQQAQALVDQYGQLLFPWMDSAGTPAKTKAKGSGVRLREAFADTVENYLVGEGIPFERDVVINAAKQVVAAR